MEKLLCYVVLILFCFGGVFAGEWDSVNSGGDVIVENGSASDSGNDIVASESYFGGDSNTASFGDGKFYTNDFYIALGLVLIIFFILLYFGWAFIRGPRNKWEKKGGFLDKIKIKIKK